MAVSGQQLSERECERIVKLREQGMSVRQVAGVMQVSKTTVQKISQNSR
jgi:IS30 family transposase